MIPEGYRDKNLVELSKIVIETGDSEAAFALQERIATASAEEKQELSSSFADQPETDAEEAARFGSEKLFADHDQEIFGEAVAHIEDFSGMLGTLRSKEAEFKADETESKNYNASTASLGVAPSVRSRMTQIGEGLKAEIDDFVSELRSLSQTIFEKYNLIASRDLRQAVVEKISLLARDENADSESDTPKSDDLVSELIENIQTQDLREGVYRRIQNKANEGLKELIRPKFEERRKNKEQVVEVPTAEDEKSDVLPAEESETPDVTKAQKIQERLKQNQADEEARQAIANESSEPAIQPEVVAETEVAVVPEQTTDMQAPSTGATKAEAPEVSATPEDEQSVPQPEAPAAPSFAEAAEAEAGKQAEILKGEEKKEVPAPTAKPEERPALDLSVALRSHPWQNPKFDPDSKAAFELASAAQAAWKSKEKAPTE